jgi:integral membrane protein (TIGR01906 family)
MRWAKSQGHVLGIVAGVLALLFILAVPSFLLTSNLRLSFSSLRLYSYGFDRYEISRVTGIPGPELRRHAAELIDYWVSDAEFIETAISGRKLYNQREVIHLRDVKGLVQGVFRIQEAAGIFLVAYMIGGLVLARRAFWRALARRLLLGGVLTLGMLVVSGIALAVAFRWLFYLFHVISFDNDFWQLDPRTDYLVAMFPEGFWFIATMLAVGLTVAEAAALAVGGWAALRYLKRLGSKQGAGKPQE